MCEHLIYILKAMAQIGLEPVAQLALYRLGVRLGWYRWRERAIGRGEAAVSSEPHTDWVALPDPEALRSVAGPDGVAEAISLADEIVAGRYRPFGGESSALRLDFPFPHAHWTAYERGAVQIPFSAAGCPYPDIKFIWEPARFGWAFTLGRAYRLSADERYPRTFWRYFEAFCAAQPPFFGPQWMNGQEVALRLLA
ncbi:MAG: hypothetical protein D6803_00590, partial [Anaerolineae bacterium]